MNFKKILIIRFVVITLCITSISITFSQNTNKKSVTEITIHGVFVKYVPYEIYIPKDIKSSKFHLELNNIKVDTLENLDNTNLRINILDGYKPSITLIDSNSQIKTVFNIKAKIPPITIYFRGTGAEYGHGSSISKKEFLEPKKFTGTILNHDVDANFTIKSFSIAFYTNGEKIKVFSSNNELSDAQRRAIKKIYGKTIIVVDDIEIDINDNSTIKIAPIFYYLE